MTGGLQLCSIRIDACGTILLRSVSNAVEAIKDSALTL